MTAELFAALEALWLGCAVAGVIRCIEETGTGLSKRRWYRAHDRNGALRIMAAQRVRDGLMRLGVFVLLLLLGLLAAPYPPPAEPDARRVLVSCVLLGAEMLLLWKVSLDANDAQRVEREEYEALLDEAQGKETRNRELDRSTR